MKKGKTFVNENYRSEWLQVVPGTSRLYREGSYFPRENGVFMVYDGADNAMGTVDKAGNIEYNGVKDEYKESFLLAAKEDIEE